MTQPGLAEAAAVARAFDPGRLTLARHASGMLKKDVADAVGVTPAAVSQYELAQSRPSAEVLGRAATVLDVQVAFFAAGRPRLRMDGTSAHFRSLRSTRQFERAQALALVSLMWEAAEALTRHVRLPEVSLPAIASTEPKAAAAAVRSAWGCQTGPLTHLLRRMEAAGVVIAVTSENQPSGRVDAFSVCLPERPVVVLGADKASIMRRRFNAGHELGHLLLHRDAVPGDARQEREAHAFAAELLAPAEQIVHVLPRRPHLPDLLAVQQEWGMSVAALLMRGRELGVYTEAAHRKAMIAMTQLGWRRAEPGDDIRGEWPVMLRRASELAGDRGFNLADLAAAVRLPLRRLRTLLSIVDDNRVALSLVR